MAADSADSDYNPHTPPNGQIQWDNQEGEVGDLSYVPNLDCSPANMEYRVDQHTIGLVTSSPAELEEYLEDHSNGTIPIPKYYSRFDDFGNDNARYLGATVDRDGESKQAGIASVPVEAALRSLVGGGRYKTSMYTLHDCLPKPCILSGPHGAILIAPVYCTAPDQ